MNPELKKKLGKICDAFTTAQVKVLTAQGAGADAKEVQLLQNQINKLVADYGLSRDDDTLLQIKARVDELREQLFPNPPEPLTASKPPREIPGELLNEYYCLRAILGNY
ncbi:MAG: hypothetical protein LAN64_00035 [Acidobacteriia bacterium]|nr:hypothetical protein [Terriglobia bacterium]